MLRVVRVILSVYFPSSAYIYKRVRYLLYSRAIVVDESQENSLIYPSEEISFLPFYSSIGATGINQLMESSILLL